MSENLNISTVETEAFLREKDGSGIAGVERIGEGGWSVAFAFVLDGVKKVIRWSDVGDNFERDAVAARFTDNDLPIPPILEMDEG